MKMFGSNGFLQHVIVTDVGTVIDANVTADGQELIAKVRWMITM